MVFNVDPDAGSANPFGRAIAGDGLIEAGTKNHAGGTEDAILRVAQGARLFHRFRSSANEVLILPWFHPEMRRIIGEVGQDRDVRRAGARRAQALAHRAVEIGD